MKQVSTWPTWKVAVGSVSVQITAIIVWAAQDFYKVTIHPALAVCIAGVIAFGIMYFSHPSPNDQITTEDVA